MIDSATLTCFYITKPSLKPLQAQAQKEPLSEGAESGFCL